VVKYQIGKVASMNQKMDDMLRTSLLLLS